MGVDDNRRLIEANAEDGICRLPPNARKRGQFLHCRRNATRVDFGDHGRSFYNISRLIVKKTRGPHDTFNLIYRRARQLNRRPILLKQLLSYLVNLIIRGLRGENYPY